ncbi:MAG: alpha-L-arabinofuranosidase, partial [Clostridia bacterium]|nr:alpha-L-arabinofuranosidase [Clostridia bacterium]
MLKKFLCTLLSCSMCLSMLSLPASAEEATTVTLLPNSESPFGEFEGFGTSLCWWANRVGYSNAMTEQAAKLFYNEETGLGLDIARYNIGGGDDPTHNHITRSDSKIPGYSTGYDANGNLIYDWSQDQNQRNVLNAALANNPNLYVEGFSNSPPYFMTNSGCSSGASDASKNNLKDDCYDDFAQYLADVTKHFKDAWGIKFKCISPMNEPNTSYWGAYSAKQEGCHFDAGTSQSNMFVSLNTALVNAGLDDVAIVGSDETSIDTAITSFNALSDDAKNVLDRIDTHTYGGSKSSTLMSTCLLYTS